MNRHPRPVPVPVLALVLPLLLAGLQACSKQASPGARTGPQGGKNQGGENRAGENRAGGNRAGKTEAKRKAPSVKLHPATEGLLPRHRKDTPLLEKVACLPSSGPGGASPCNLQRVYRDGSLYLLNRKKGQASGHWHHLARLKPGTVARLARLFAEVCDGKDPVFGNDRGSFIYRVHSPGCTRQLVVTGIPAGGLERLTEVSNLINTNMVPGSSEAKPPAQRTK